MIASPHVSAYLGQPGGLVARPLREEPTWYQAGGGAEEDRRAAMAPGRGEGHGLALPRHPALAAWRAGVGVGPRGAGDHVTTPVRPGSVERLRERLV